MSLYLSRSTGRAKSGFQPQLAGRAFDPRFDAVGRSTLHAVAEGLQLGLGFGFIHVPKPAPRTRNGPIAQPDALLGRSVFPDPQTGPTPLGSIGHQIGAKRIAFHVTHDLVEVIVGLAMPLTKKDPRSVR